MDANARAQPLRRIGKLGAAREQLQICADAQCPGIVRNDCALRLDELERSQPTIVFEAKDAGGNDVSVVRVTMDGRVLTERLDGTALAVDPGEHAFSFEVTGQPTLARRFVLHEGEKGRHEQIVLVSAATAPAAATGTPAPSSPLAAGIIPSPRPSQPLDNDTALKKADDDPCESDDQCTSGACADGKCAEGSSQMSGSTKLRKIWIGVAGSVDLIGLPASDDVCVLGNSAGYTCVDPTTGVAFPADQTTNANIRRGPATTAGDGVAGGVNPGNVRLALSFDYAFGTHVLLGARAGYVLLTAPSSAFAPIHLEARISVLVGKDALAKGIAPMFMLAGGAGEFDASFPVVLQLKSGGTLNETAWITAGPAFAAGGAGVRFLLGPAVAATVLLKCEGAFGGSAGFLLGFAPEVSMQLGL